MTEIRPQMRNLIYLLLLTCIMGCRPALTGDGTDLSRPGTSQPAPGGASAPGPAGTGNPGAGSSDMTNGTVSHPPIEVLHWTVPEGHKRIAFLGDRLLTITSNQRSLQMVNHSGQVLWSSELSHPMSGMLFRSDLTQGFAVTETALVWMDLSSGEIVGQAPSLELCNQTLWSQDWLLTGCEVHAQGSDPKAPGKSYSYTTWTLFHVKPGKKAWEQVGVLLERGGVLANMSDDGKVVLVESMQTGDWVAYAEGRAALSFHPSDSSSFFLISRSGRYFAERYRNGVTVYDAQGKRLFQKTVPGDQLTWWGERVVVSDEEAFSVYDLAGQQLFHRVGHIDRNQFSDKFLIVDADDHTLLVDATGTTALALPATRPLLTTDGRWAYQNYPDRIDVYPLPR
jgi:hypothetical protein